MCLLKIFNKGRESVRSSKESILKIAINYNESFFCSYNKKRHLVLYGSISNSTAKDITIKISVSTNGRLVSQLSKPSLPQKSVGTTIWDNKPQILVSATITNNPHTIKASAIEKFTLIIVDFNLNERMSLFISSEGEKQSVPIMLKDISDK